MPQYFQAVSILFQLWTVYLAPCTDFNKPAAFPAVFAESRLAFVFFRKQRYRNRPLDTYGDIGPQHPSVAVGHIKITALIGEQSRRAEHAKSVAKPLGMNDWRRFYPRDHPHRTAEGWLPMADVDRHIEDFPLKHLHHFGLLVGELVVQPAQVFLDEKERLSWQKSA